MIQTLSNNMKRNHSKTSNPQNYIYTSTPRIPSCTLRNHSFSSFTPRLSISLLGPFQVRRDSRKRQSAGVDMEKRRFAVLLCAVDSEYVKQRYGGYSEVFVGLLGEEGELWDGYRVCLGEFPDDGELEAYEGFVITGSCSDAHGNDPWVCKLVSLLKKLDSMHKKLLGFCFGHQILSRAIGGKVGRAANGWDLGVTTISLPHSKFLPTPQIPSTLRIIECHQDEVLQLPDRAEVMAWSEKTGIEMFRCEDHIMGIQGHPEYCKDILLHLLDRLQQCNLIQSDHVETAKASLKAHEPDQEKWKRLCLAFLKGPSPLL